MINCPVPYVKENVNYFSFLPFHLDISISNLLKVISSFLPFLHSHFGCLIKYKNRLNHS